MSEEAKPARKIKPPSASFLKSKEMPAVEVASTAETSVASEASGEDFLGAPSVEEVPDQDLFTVPDADPAPAPAVPPPAAAAMTSGAEDSKMSGDRLAAEVRELQDIVNGTECLQYLRARVQRAVDEGIDPLSLVSFYRLVVRSLGEGTEQSRRDYETMRSKASKLELELATALAQGSLEGTGTAAAASVGISDEAREKLGQLEHELAQANEQREKLLVDFKNMRERVQKDLDIRIFREKEKFFKSFLPVLDAFERAQQSLNESSSVTALLEGFRLTGTMLMEALQGEGLEEVDTSGVFDPRFHEAVGEVQNETRPDEYIFDELARGYRLGERLIRPAMVRISRNPKGVLPRQMAEEEATSE